MSQKQNSKSGKKFIKSARSVLALPKKAFWPIIPEPESSSFVDLLQNALKVARTIQPGLCWSEIKKLSKEERKNQIKTFYSNLSQDILAQHQKALNLKKDLSIGVNEVCRALERNDLTCCLVSGSVNPKLLVSHIVDLSKAKRVPILIVSSLKENIKNSLGFSALAIGLKNEIRDKEDHELHGLCNEIINLFNKNYSYESQTLVNEESEEPEMDISMKESSFDIKFNNEDNIIPISEVNLSEIYLYRKSTNYRVFKANELACPSEQTGNDSRLDSHIQMDLTGVEDEDDAKIVEKRRRYYESPVILRVQSNPNKRRKPKKKKKKIVQGS